MIVHTYIYVRIYFTIILFQWKSLTYFQEIDRCLVVHTTHSTKTVNISLQFTDVEMLLHISLSLFLFSAFGHTIEYGKKIANCEPLIKTFSCSFSIFFFWNFMLVNSPFLHILSPKKEHFPLLKFNFFLWNLLYRCFAFFSLLYFFIDWIFHFHTIASFSGTLRLNF